MAEVGFQPLLRGFFHSAQRRLKSRARQPGQGVCVPLSHQGIPRGRMRRGPSPPNLEGIPDENDYCLVAALTTSELSTILKAIHFREHATCFATKNGIKVTVENAKCVQANAFIQVHGSCFFNPVTYDILHPAQ